MGLPNKVEGVEYGDRWSKGIPHNPKSIELMERIAEIDFHLFNDYFMFKMGGDGDNGETLMYMLDIYFDEQEKKDEDNRTR
jgi:hypothetical protein